MECHQDINARDPLLWPLLALRMLACAYPGNAVPGRYIIDYAARQVSGRSVNLLPWFVRSRAGLRAIRHQADEGYCPCLQWSCTSFRWASEGRYRPYPPIDQRVCHRHRAAFLYRYVHTAAKAPHRLCASSPGSIWGFRIGKGIRFQMGIMRLHTARRYFGAPWWRSRSVPG